MNEDAFARRFYADRSELEALGIVLAVEKPVDGLVEQENYSLPPENFHLPPIEFTDKELAALRTALQLLDGEFAYAEPLRLALQQISWGRPSPLAAPEQQHGRARDHRLGRRSRRLAAAGEDRDRDLPPQDDRVRLLHDGARRARRRGASTPTSCSTRAASSTSSGARTSAARSGSSGSRGSAARSATRPRPSTTSSARRTSTRAPTRTGSTGSSASRSGPPRSGSVSGSRGRSSATSGATARSAPRAVTPSPATACSPPSTPTPAS